MNSIISLLLHSTKICCYKDDYSYNHGETSFIPISLMPILEITGRIGKKLHKLAKIKKSKKPADEMFSIYILLLFKE